MKHKTVYFELVGDVFISGSGNEPIDDNDWNELCKRMSLRDFRVKIVEVGTAVPNSAQRQKLRSVLEDRTEPTAVLCHSMAARTAVSVVSLFFKGLKAFGSESEKEACEWLGIEPTRFDEVKAGLERTKIRLGLLEVRRTGT